MAIPLVGSRPTKASSANTQKDLISGDSSNFLTGYGSWTAMGSATISFDSNANKSVWGARDGWTGGSLKVVCNAADKGVQLSIPGTFKAGLSYQAMVAVWSEDDPANDGYEFDFGDIAANDYQNPIVTPDFGGGGTAGRHWKFMAVVWRPTADRSAVYLRFWKKYHNSATTQNIHIGLARVLLVTPTNPGFEVGTPWSVGGTTDGGVENRYGNTYIMYPEFTEASSYDGSSGGGVILGFGPNSGTKLEFNGGPAYRDAGGINIYSWGDNNDIEIQVRSASNLWVNSCSNTDTNGHLSESGIEIEVGFDWVGMYISEYDASTLQMYADTSGGYWMELADRGDKGWRAVDSNEQRTGLLSCSPFRHLAAAPTTPTPVEGDCYYDTAAHVLKVYDGSVWRSCW